MADPISIFIQTDNSSNLKEQNLIKLIKENFDLSPAGIKKFLKLDRPIYQETAAYGHFGRKHDPIRETFTWEALSSLKLFEELL